MERVWHAIKDHPWITAGGVAILIVIFMLRSGGGSSAAQSAGVVTYTTDPNIIAANTATSLASTNAQRDIAVAGLAAGVANHTADLQAQTSQIYIGAAQDVSTKQITAQTDINSVLAGVETHLSDNALAGDRYNTDAAIQAKTLDDALSTAQLNAQSAAAAAAQQANNFLLAASVFFR